jgi:hypothetical protein
MPNNVGNYNKDIEIKIQGGKYKLTLKASVKNKFIFIKFYDNF